MKILFIGFRDLVHPCYDDFLEAMADKHEVTLFDPEGHIPEQFGSAQVIVDQGGWASHEMVDSAKAVKLWQVIGTGLDHLDVKYILDKKVPLANTPGVFSGIALAEHALFFMFCFAKNLHLSTSNLRSGVFYHPMNDELEGKTLGLVGFGASGRELAKRAAALGMRVIAIDALPTAPEILREHHIDFFGKPEEIDKLLAEADYVSLHTPLTSKTRHLINQRALGRMKPTAVLINVARGEIVDQSALLEALETGTIRGAGLDTFAHEPIDPSDPILKMSNVVATPHIAGGTRGTLKRRTKAAAENVFRLEKGLPPLYQVTKVE